MFYSASWPAKSAVSQHDDQTQHSGTRTKWPLYFLYHPTSLFDRISSVLSWPTSRTKKSDSRSIVDNTRSIFVQTCLYRYTSSNSKFQIQRSQWEHQSSRRNKNSFVAYCSLGIGTCAESKFYNWMCWNINSSLTRPYWAQCSSGRDVSVSMLGLDECTHPALQSIIHDSTIRAEFAHLYEEY